MLGDDHPDTLKSTRSLAITYSSLGRFEEAKQLQEKVVEVRARTLGEDHPDTLKSMYNLGITYRSLDRLEEAKQLGEKVVEARARTLGKGHPDPDIAQPLNNLGFLLQEMGDLAGARPYHEEALGISMRVPGPDDHPEHLSLPLGVGQAAGDPLGPILVTSLANAAARHAFANDLANAVARVVAKYHDDEAENGRTYSVMLGAYPKRGNR